MANKGLKEENTMLSFSISDVNISIDLAKLNKNIIATIPLTIDKGPMPINVGVIYNDQNKNVVSNFGNGFRFSEDKTISLIPAGGGYKIENSDGSENIFTFYGPTEDGSIYKDIYGNKLYDLSFDDYDEFKLEDKYNNFIRFLEDSSNQISVINHLGKYAYMYNYGGNYFELYNEYNDILKLENTNPQGDSYIDTYTYKENNIVIYSGSISYDSNRINGIVVTKNQSSVRDISIDYDTVNNKRVITFKNNITKEFIRIEIDLPNELSIEVNEGYFDDNIEYIIKTTTIDYYDKKTIVTDKDLVTTSNSYISTYLFDNNYLLENIIDNNNYVKALKYNNQIKQKEFETSNIYQGNDSNFILDLADYVSNDNNTISISSVTPSDYTNILSLMYKNSGSGYIFHSFPQAGIGGEAKGLVLWVKNKSGSGNLKVTFRLGVTKDEIILSEQEILPDYQMICLGITMYTSFLFMDFRIEITGSLKLEFGRLEILDYNPKQVYLYEGNNLVGVNNQNNNSYNNYNLNNIVDSSYGTNNDSKRYQYNSNNLVTKEIMAYGVEKEYSYSGLNLISVSLKDNGTTIWTDNYSYTNNELTRVFNKYTELTEYQYSNHNISYKQIGTVNATFYSYNNYDDVTEVLRSISEKISINYENRKVDNVEVHNGISYDYTYDNKNRLTSVSRESVVIESYTYDNNGLITSITKIDRKTLITYNDKKQITNIKLTNLAGTVTYKEYNFSYDSKLRLINVSDGNNHVLKTYNYNIYENNDNLLSVNYLNSSNIIYELDYIYHQNKIVYKNYVNDSGKLYIEEINRNNFISKNLMNLDNYIRLSTNLIGTSFLEGLVLKGSGTLVVPSVISGSAPPDRLINNIYTITTKPQTAYLCYEGGMYQDNSDAIGIAFWFNFDTISNDKYLFTIAQADSPNARKVFCYIDSLKIKIKILNSDGSLKTIMTSPVIIDTNTWHFIGFSYENDYEAEDDTFIYRLNVDGRYIEYITSDLQEQLGRVSNAKYYIGYYYHNNALQSIMDGYITALAISNGRIINNYDLDVYYKISKEFVIKPLDMDGAINYSAVNEYKKDLLTNYDIIPLHSSVISLKNEKPTTYNEVVGNRFVHNNFNYNKNLRNMCFTPNDMLEYDYNISNSATIIMDVFINSISDVSYLVQNYGNSYMSLYLEENELVLEYRNNPSSPFVTKHTNLFVTTNYCHKIGISYSASNFRIDFAVFLDNSMYSDWKYLSTVFSPMKTVIGSTSLGKYALDGNISMVAIGQGLIDQNEFNNVKNNLTCYTSLNKYDRFNHLFKKEINKNRFNILTTTFVYDKDRIISQTTKTIQKNYLYDSVGNISGITDSGTNNHSYGYDKYNRIVNYDNTSNYYSYDSEGNIISAGNTSFIYDSDTKMLASVNNNSITYSTDNPLLPIHYDNIDFEWLGTKLSKATVSLLNNEKIEITFEYNEQGLRTKKTEIHKQGDTTIYTNYFNYYYDENNKLITEIRNNDRYDYLYDDTEIYGYILNLSTRYYYVKDIIGQIIGIVNEEGTVIGRYDYDPYGNIIINTVGSSNKILYKGYYYDDYIELYYLKSRYYSPEWHRFISPDSIDYLDIYDLNGVNLFSYCNNNPVMYSDGDGHLAVLTSMIIFGTLFGLATGFGFSAGKQLIENDWDFSKVDWGKVANSTIVGGALGFSFAMGVGYLGPVMACAATASKAAAGIAFGISAGVTYAAGALGYATEEWINGRGPDFGKAMLNGALVAFEGSINYMFGGIVGSVGTIGTKGKFLRSREWYSKFAFGQEFTFPLKYGIDLIRKKF